MNSKYSKNIGKEIKKSKSEINFHLNFDKINAEKELQKIYFKNKLLNPEISKNISQSENNSRTSEETSEINLNENKNFTIKSLESENTEDNKKEETFSKLENKMKGKNDVKKLIDINPNSNEFCRCCGKKFDEKLHIPLLLKCNHIFCKICLGKYFTDDENIICPIDGDLGNIFEALSVRDNENNKNNDLIKPKEINNYNNRNKGNKKGNNLNSIKSLFYKSKSHKELFKNDNNSNNNNFMKKRNSRKINLYDKVSNIISNNSKNSNIKNIIPYFSLTNRNKDLNLNIYKKKYLNPKSQDNSEINFNKTSNHISKDELNKKEIKKIKKIVNKRNIKHRSKSVINNYISNSNNTNEDDSGNFCTIHPEQRISHFVEETRELICIHCAFNKLKNDPNIQIKEIPEKCKEYIAELETIIENNKNYIHIIKNSIGHINENKQNEEKKIIEIYEELSNLLVTNRNNYLIKIEEIYQQNKSNMIKKLENFEDIINVSEKMKDDFYTLLDKAPNEFNFLAQGFNQFIREINDKNNSEIHIMQYNFSHDELNKIIKYINNFADVKSKKKVFKFDINKTEQENQNDFDNFIDLDSIINSDYKKNYFKKYFQVYKPMKQINTKNIYNDYYINNKSSTYKNNHLMNYYKDSENVKEILNKYIASTNLIRDSLYNSINMKNSSIENVKNDNNSYKYLKDNERLNLLKKYKFPLKGNFYN